MQESAPRSRRDAVPAFVAEIAVDADRRTLDRRPRKIRENERDMAGAGDHRMRLVGAAVTRAAGMHVHGGDHAQTAALADVPERAKVPAVKVHDAGVECVWVEVVVENEIDDPRAALVAESQQERPALPAGGLAPLPPFCR